MRRAAILLLLLAAWPATARAGTRPNVVIVETDDQTVADLATMPLTRALIGGRGVTFEQSVVSLSECCPSRATLLTGRYAHNHGVLTVRPPFGGARRLDGAETLPVWLQRAGYATGLVGKYLNGYAGREIPPGWTAFEGLIGRGTYRYYDFDLTTGDSWWNYGTGPADYQTDVITSRAEAFVERSAGERPFFLWTTYVAPHTGMPRDLRDPRASRSTVPAPRHREAFLGAPLPRPPSFDEPDVSDKPPLMRRRPRMRQWRIAALQETWRQRRAALLAVDEGVARIAAALERTGELRDTLLIFTSDNGFMLGEHRVPQGKVLPYEPSIRVPLLIRGPGVPAGATRRQLVWNGDLAPTILAAAGASAPFELDGRSILDFAHDPDARSARAVLLEGPPARGTNGLPRFTGLRTPRHTYVEHIRGAVELYDLARDPHQLANLARDPAARALRRSMADRLARLRGCAGAACR